MYMKPNCYTKGVADDEVGTKTMAEQNLNSSRGRKLCDLFPPGQD